jgi:hypothetical protein
MMNNSDMSMHPVTGLPIIKSECVRAVVKLIGGELQDFGAPAADSSSRGIQDQGSDADGSRGTGSSVVLVPRIIAVVRVKYGGKQGKSRMEVA